LDFDIRSCFDIRPVRLTKKDLKKDCSMSEKAFLKRVEPSDQAIEEVVAQFPSIEIFNPRPLFCDGVKCHASDGTKPYYFNKDYLNYEAAEKVIGALKTSPSPKT
jgi:hypothetical protein